MKPVEFRRQIFSGSAHWDHGLCYRLRRLEGGGVALFSRPAFAGFVTRDDAALSVESLATGACGRLFWMHRQTCSVYGRDPANELIEPMIALAACDGDSQHTFGRMFSAGGCLWILDKTASRLIACRPGTFQIVVEIVLPPDPIDATEGGGRLFTLHADGIRTYTLDGILVGGPHHDHLSRPVAIGAAATADGQWLYAIDADVRAFLRFHPDTGAFDSELGALDDAGAGFAPRLFVVHPEGNLFVSDGSPVAHEFAADGGYIGTTDDVSPLSAIESLAVDERGDLYVGSPEGIARFSPESGIAGNKGQFYTRTLDNGTDHDEGWQRIDLSAELDNGGALDVYYASASERGLVEAVTGIFDRAGSAADKARALDSLFDGQWKGPQALRGVSPAGAASTARAGFARNMSHSVLLSSGTRRYLWLKLELSGLAPRAQASVRELRLYYPRLSYLRYLPAVYQQDRVSQEFLERFLSMFETIFSGLEATIERIPEVFDPDLTPSAFLDWLAQWLDLGIEEDWPSDVKRRLIQRAADLYQSKGTPRGLADFIEVVTNTRPIIRESFDAERPYVLGDGIALGVDSRIQRQPATDLRRDQRMVLGHASVLGTTGIRAATQVAVNPFRAAAHRFTVLLDLPRQRFQRYERGLHRIIRESAPAHTSYDIRLVSGRLGGQSAVGINFRPIDPQPTLLGYAALGGSICTSRVWYGPQIGVDATLAAQDSTRMRASTHGDR